jgi:hypothetical protein
MDEEVLDFMRDKLLTRIRVHARGLLYVDLRVHSPNVTMLDRVAQLADNPRIRVKRVSGTYAVYVLAQAAVRAFCDAVIPHLEKAEPLYMNLVLARAVAVAPWYERYKILEQFLSNGGDWNGLSED